MSYLFRYHSSKAIEEKAMSEKRTQQSSIRQLLPYAYHEAGQAVVGHVVGRLIEKVFIKPDGESGYRGCCRFSSFIESANDHTQWQEGSANPEIITILYAGTVATEIICNRHGWDYEVWQGGGKADLKAIDRWRREVLKESKRCSLVKESCLAEARNILARSIDAVDALAVQLVLHEQIAGGEAHRIIRKALGEIDTDWRLAAWEIKD